MFKISAIRKCDRVCLEYLTTSQKYSVVLLIMFLYDHYHGIEVVVEPYKDNVNDR